MTESNLIGIGRMGALCAASFGILYISKYAENKGVIYQDTFPKMMNSRLNMCFITSSLLQGPASSDLRNPLGERTRLNTLVDVLSVVLVTYGLSQVADLARKTKFVAGTAIFGTYAISAYTYPSLTDQIRRMNSEVECDLVLKQLASIVLLDLHAREISTEGNILQMLTELQQRLNEPPQTENERTAEIDGPQLSRQDRNRIFNLFIEHSERHHNYTALVRILNPE